MVFFTCNHCGDAVKKPAVEKHYLGRCRGATKSVSCMDCQKDFHGEDYVAHTKCITEAQKYSGKDYVHKESKNAKKQDGWTDIVRSILDSKEHKLSAGARDVFERLQAFENVPRKKPKFVNFVKNCVRINMRFCDESWSVLENELQKLKQQNAEAAKATQKRVKTDDNESQQHNGENGLDEPAKKKSKKKSSTDETTTQTQQNGKSANGLQENGQKTPKKKNKAAAEETTELVDENDETIDTSEFQWIEVLEKLVKKASDEGIELEKLKKKILKKYKSKLEVDDFDDKQQKKFEKKFNKNLKKCQAVQVHGELVKLCG